MTPSAVAKLVAKWRDAACSDDCEHDHCVACRVHATELEQALATAPSEQAAAKEVKVKVESTDMQERAQQLWRELDGLDWSSHEQAIVGILRDALEAVQADQPQPASGGALAYANELIEDFLANEECGCAKGVYPHPCPRCIVTIEEARKYIATCTVPEAALASHDQKVRGDVLELALNAVGTSTDLLQAIARIRSLAGAVEKK